MKERCGNMRRVSWQMIYGLGLIFVSALIYFIHFVVFRDAHHIFIYLLGDIAFVPIEVLIVTLILERILTAREKRNMMKKMNMVIGTFFSEVGIELLRIIAKNDREVDRIGKHLVINTKWTEETFKKVVKIIQGYDYTVEINQNQLERLKEFLVLKRNFMLRLLENPNLLEHDAFTDLLWAVFHLLEEVDFRCDREELSKEDVEHLVTDVQRVYKLLVQEWLSYMQHLQNDYPFLFSFAIGVNPFVRTEKI